jgi:transcriptional regulator with XRE-family HTH domain
MSNTFALKRAQQGDLTMNPIVEKKIGENVRRLRIKAGLTQEALAAKLQLEGCDITRSALAKIEVGQRHLYPDEIILLCAILKTTYDDIFNIK